MGNKLFIIGINEYRNHPHLKSSVKDAIDLKNILLEKYHFDEEAVTSPQKIGLF